MAVFKVGDKVEAIDDLISGIVTAIIGNSISVLCDDGFTINFEEKELVVITGSIQVSNYEVAQVKKEKELAKKRKPIVSKAKERNLPKMEVDLHINQLIKNSKGLGNYEMLNLQLETAKRQLEFAISKRIQKVVFIHGVGEGVLKEELRYLFNKYDNIKHYDADYQKYGLGATEIYIYQNV
jgi:dsDNA-specific endonuclease/ATPase MutS2